MKVFISYSWTSESYKAFVKSLAESLLADGVEVILDQVDLRAGHDMHAFMERSVTNADKVLILCNDSYVEKANDRLGGVGAETSIITPDVYGRSDQEKFIPVMIDDKLPTYLRSRYAIDMREGHRKAGYYELLDTLLERKSKLVPRRAEWLEDDGVSANSGKDEKKKSAENTESAESEFGDFHFVWSFRGREMTVFEIAAEHNMSLSDTRQELNRLVNLGLIRMTGHNKYKVVQGDKERSRTFSIDEEQLIEFLCGKWLTKVEIANHFGVNLQATYRILTELVEQGELVVRGDINNKRYSTASMWKKGEVPEYLRKSRSSYT